MTSYSTVPSPPAVPLAVAPVWQRLLVTLAVVGVYRLGCHIPLPGVDPGALDSLSRLGRVSALTAEHVSIFALGVIPIFSALMVVEFLKLIIPPFARWAGRDRYNAGRVNRGVRYIALLLAAFQGLGIARALVNISGLVPEADWTFALTTVVTFVAATALLGWLGDRITRHGFGNGFWILLLTPALLQLPRTVASSMTLAQIGAVRPSAPVIALGFIVVMIGLLATLAIARYRAEADAAAEPASDAPSRGPMPLPGAAPGSPLPNLAASAPKRERPQIGRDVVDVWPALLGTYFGSTLLVFFISFGDGDHPAFLVGGFGRLLVIAAFIAFFSFLRTLSQPSGAGASQRLIVMMAAAQIVTCAGGELLMRYVGTPFAINGPWIILAVAVVMSAVLSFSTEAPAARS